MGSAENRRLPWYRGILFVGQTCPKFKQNALEDNIRLSITAERSESILIYSGILGEASKNPTKIQETFITTHINSIAKNKYKKKINEIVITLNEASPKQ